MQTVKIISGGFLNQDSAKADAELIINNIKNGIFPNIKGEIKVVSGTPISSYCGDLERWDVVEVIKA
jgi:hypothetical protein